MESLVARSNLLPGSVPTIRNSVSFVTVDVTYPPLERIRALRLAREMEDNLPVITKRFPAMSTDEVGCRCSVGWLSNSPKLVNAAKVL